MTFYPIQILSDLKWLIPIYNWFMHRNARGQLNSMCVISYYVSGKRPYRQLLLYMYLCHQRHYLLKLLICSCTIYVTLNTTQYRARYIAGVSHGYNGYCFDISLVQCLGYVGLVHKILVISIQLFFN